jgi:hypothetical protein
MDATAATAAEHEAGKPAPNGAAAPQEITLMAWAMPDAVPAGERFAVKIGAKSSAGCALCGGVIEVRNADDAVLASAPLSASPWPGTGALYWTEIALQAPAAPGRFAFSARFDAAEIDPPHRSASLPISVTIAERPAHTLTVTVVAQGAGTPLEDVQIRFGPYRAVTDASGRAAVKLPTGRHQLLLWKAGYEAPVTVVNLQGDASVEVAIVALPEEDPDAHWTG